MKKLIIGCLALGLFVSCASASRAEKEAAEKAKKENAEKAKPARVKGEYEVM